MNRLSKSDWDALSFSEKDELVAHDFRRQKIISEVREKINGNEHGPMDAGWLVMLLLEQI